MTLTRTLDRVREVDSERALTVFFLVVGIVMFALTVNFEYSSSALFPRLTAGVLVVGSLLLLVQDRLPAPLQRIVAEPVSIAEPDDEFESSPAAETDETGADESPTTRQVPDAVATYGLLLGYLVVSYLIGILWATPIFALAYSWWFKQSRVSTAIVVGTSLAIVFAFYFLVDAPLEDGLLLEWIW